MRRTWLFPVVLAGSSAVVIAQPDSSALRYGATITEADLRDHLTILAGDAYEGRETGERGQKLAAEYLKEQFRSFGIPPIPGERTGVTEGFFQSFDLVVDHPGALSLELGDRAYVFLKDILYFRDNTPVDTPIPEMTYCNSIELASLPPDTKAALVMMPAPEKADPADPGIDGVDELAEVAELKEMELLLVCTDRFPQAVGTFGHWLRSDRMRLAEDAATKGPAKRRTQVMIVSPAVGDAILASGGSSFAREWKRVSKGRRSRTRVITSPLKIIDRPVRTPMSSENVLAYIEGGDKKDELVVVTAHYDHIGMHDGEVYNGADDDGSGTVALLELAQAFGMAKAQGHGPRRSLLFMPVAGEEKGLLGSRYYSEHPVFPIENTVADLNIDMIGRFDSAHATSGPYVYIIGSDRLSKELHHINERANYTYVGLDLDESFNAKDDPNRFYFRSDHYNFARKGVPVIFYFSGVHEDYHQPGDEVDKIRFDLLRQRALLVFHTAWILANQEERIVVDGKVEE